ncbi:hypothetical protein LY76DRAFT_636065 [Colletotrichum caudatum]|nr:hypothetical protein LY76DRAFT_636065 [Colletotrichum caudatum]
MAHKVGWDWAIIRGSFAVGRHLQASKLTGTEIFICPTTGELVEGSEHGEKDMKVEGEAYGTIWCECGWAARESGEKWRAISRGCLVGFETAADSRNIAVVVSIRVHYHHLITGYFKREVVSPLVTQGRPSSGVPWLSESVSVVGECLDRLASIKLGTEMEGMWMRNPLDQPPMQPSRCKRKHGYHPAALVVSLSRAENKCTWSGRGG